MKLTCSQSVPPCGALLLVEASDTLKKQITVEWSNATELFIEPDLSLKTDAAIYRYLLKNFPQTGLIELNALDFIEVETWFELASSHLSVTNHENDHLIAFKLIEDKLQTQQQSTSTNGKYSVADLFIFGSLFVNPSWKSLGSNYPATEALCKKIVHDPKFAALHRLICDKICSVVTNEISNLPEQSEGGRKTKQKDEGKFVELPGAEVGKVVVRFPPEASGFLHIGHAKAALLNQYYQQAFEGTLIMRFDDTNPAKENAEFEKVILEDLEMLEIKPDKWTHTSDWFDKLIELNEQLLKSGKAYVDDTDPETMKLERDQKKDSKCRNQSVEENLKLWQEMKLGSDKGQQCCVRLKISMQALNGCMRDPTIYRCKAESHVRTGDKYKVYPTYDFACPIVDSLEGVTHALRTTEYHDRDEQYYFIIDTLGLRKPYIWDYARLNMMNTVMSKRKLTWFVDQGIVDGWDDPRFPTVRGIRRRGLTVEGLKQFIVAQGGSRSVVTMEWDKIWAFNRKVIDPIAPRYTALARSALVEVVIADAIAEIKMVAKHPKNDAVGQKALAYASKILIEHEDALLLKENEAVTLINWGNIVITKINRSGDNKVLSVGAKLDLDNKDFKNTLKLTWLGQSATAANIPLVCIHYDHIITKAAVGKEEDFKQFINYNSKHTFEMIGESELRNVKKGDIIQLQRKGFYICDQAYQSHSVYTSMESPCFLIYVPDGHVKDLPTGICKAEPGKGKQKTESSKVSRNSPKPEAKEKSDPKSEDLTHINQQIVDQGEKVRQLKADKAEKVVINSEVGTLLELKKKFKELSGQDWKPCASTPAITTPPVSTKTVLDSSNPQVALNEKILKQGDKVRQLKTEKAEKALVETEVKALLELKKQYKELCGQEWKAQPVATATTVQTTSTASMPSAAVVQGDSNVNASSGDALKDQVDAQAELVRSLKAKKSPKNEVDAAVARLLALKEQFKQVTGVDLTAKQNASQSAKQTKSAKQPTAVASAVAKPTQQHDAAHDEKKSDMKKQTRLGLEVKKEENFPEWYSQVITKAEMIEYYDISGCYILRPWAFAIWESIQSWFDCEIKKLGVSNAYFPMFVSQAALEKEKTHIADFAPEVAWVTKSGQSELSEPIAIRPTSETVMYPTFAKWVQSHRDLPIKLNQWCNVVRWEFKHPTPFLRTREFLWQEGHTVYANAEDAQKEVYAILNLYAAVYEDLLAVPVIKGRKTDKEKFAGGDFTTTVEVYVPISGRGIQAATSHHLGQNFSKMFEIVFEDPETQEKKYAFQNSWGLTTRSIGVLTMLHGDDNGLVLAPRVAKIQIIIVPCGITATLAETEKARLFDECEALQKLLVAAGIRADCDLRPNYSPGWKFNHWELKGVPIRIELGPRDIATQQFVVVRRDTMSRESYARREAVDVLTKLLEEIHRNLFAKAKKCRDDHLVTTDDWETLTASLMKRCIILAPFCGQSECEDKIKKDSTKEESVDAGAPAMGAKSLCIPFDQPSKESIATKKCIHPRCNQSAKFYTLFGRSY